MALFSSIEEPGTGWAFFAWLTLIGASGVGIFGELLAARILFVAFYHRPNFLIFSFLRSNSGCSSHAVERRPKSAKSCLSSDRKIFHSKNYFMWHFKKNLPIAELNPEDEKWSVLNASSSTEPMLIRVNTTARQWAKHPELGIRVGFAIPLNYPKLDALPDAEENFTLNQAEDKMLAYLKSSGPAIHVLSITTGTFKEFVFYVKNGDTIPAVHERLKTEITSHDVQCVAEYDPKWAVYGSFLQ